MSGNGVPLETIADLCGHASTAVTEEVYRHQLKPVITKGAEGWVAEPGLALEGRVVERGVAAEDRPLKLTLP